MIVATDIGLIWKLCKKKNCYNKLPVVLFAFASKLGCCIVNHAELWAILLSIRIVWVRGFRDFIVESDYQVAINFLQHDCVRSELTFRSHHCYRLVQNILLNVRQGRTYLGLVFFAKEQSGWLFSMLCAIYWELIGNLVLEIVVILHISF